MARSASIVSDSDEKARDASETNDKATDDDNENGVQGEEEEDDEEYEIEEILTHRRGMFEDVRPPWPSQATFSNSVSPFIGKDRIFL